MADMEPAAYTSVSVNLSYLLTVARNRGYHSFDLRDDSRLAYLWATYSLGSMSAEEVVDEMAVAQFLHSATDYGGEVETSMRRIANALKTKCGRRLSWSDCWRIVRSYAPDALQHTAIERIGGLPPLSTPPADC